MGRYSKAEGIAFLFGYGIINLQIKEKENFYEQL